MISLSTHGGRFLQRASPSPTSLAGVVGRFSFEGGSVAIKPSQTEPVAGFRLAVTRPAFTL